MSFRFIIFGSDFGKVRLGYTNGTLAVNINYGRLYLMPGCAFIKTKFNHNAGGIVGLSVFRQTGKGEQKLAVEGAVETKTFLIKTQIRRFFRFFRQDSRQIKREAPVVSVRITVTP